MVATRVACTPDPNRAAAAVRSGALAVRLFGIGGNAIGEVGCRLSEGVSRLAFQPTLASWDFLAFALSVTAADTFVSRGASADGWTRELHVEIELANPVPWRRSATDLAWLLQFLSGDLWQFDFQDGGLGVPTVRGAKTPAEDVVCLFSGGLDSYIGAIDLVAQMRTPLLVSQAYRMEHGAQSSLSKKVGKQPPPLRHLQLDAAPSHPLVRENARETSMRTRSLLFIAYGLLVASSMKSLAGSVPTLFLPENGFIALNLPLTLRRIGSLSTRTTHPTFLSRLNRLIPELGVACTLANPYEFKTKGEMIRDCRKRVVVERCGKETISCGKGGRRNQQCGRCVPCLIRRAAFHAAGIDDGTVYEYVQIASQRDYDDVLSMRVAIERAKGASLRDWLRGSAPFPEGAPLADYLSVARRGLAEVDTLLKAHFSP